MRRKKKKQKVYPIETEEVEGGNEAIGLAEELGVQNKQRLYVAYSKNILSMIWQCAEILL